jgi:hypothetical protein
MTSAQATTTTAGAVYRRPRHHENVKIQHIGAW